MVLLSPRLKFIMITLDDVLLVAAGLVIVYFFFNDYFLVLLTIAVIGLVLFIIAKFFLVYPVLNDTPYVKYDVVGLTGTVVETVTESTGRVRIGQQLWTARCQGDAIQIGSKIKVQSREAMIVWVVPLNNSEKSQGAGDT